MSKMLKYYLLWS